MAVSFEEFFVPTVREYFIEKDSYGDGGNWFVLCNLGGFYGEFGSERDALSRLKELENRSQ